MIVKKIRNKKTAKPRQRQIADLVDYIRHPHDVNPKEKIEHSGGRNFISSTHAGQKMEMIALATESVHSKMPVTHWVFSWKENEQPTGEQVEELVDIFLEGMGLTGHQVVYGLHYNTENYHVHIAVNRMNPDTMKVVDPNHGFDIEAALKIIAQVEYKQGWTPENNAVFTVQDGEIVRRAEHKRKLKPTQAAQDFECATGEKSAQRIAQERGHAIISNAQSWAELHTKLAEIGLRFEKKGSGAIVFVGDIAVKASSVDRAFSMKNLCKRLGEFVPGTYTPEVPKIEPEPVSTVNLDEWRQYRAKCAAIPAKQPFEADEALIQAKRRHREEQEQKIPKFAKFGRTAVRVVRYYLKVHQRKELHKLRVEARRRREKRPRFAVWLRSHGLYRQADKWRYRHMLEAVPPPLREVPPLPTEQKYDPIKAYAAHRQALLKDFPDVEPSRVDAYIALSMREKGFKREVVLETLVQCAPQVQPEQTNRDWRRYAERATSYAFGIAGDVKLARSAAYLEAQREKEVLSSQKQEQPRQEAERQEGSQPVSRMRMR